MKRENRKTHCFIDYENVHESGFEGVEALSDGDSVTIFISSVSHKISLVVLETLLRKKCELNIIHTIGTGKNNLDFQLIAEVGYQIGRHTYESKSIQFAIISKDRGYENVVTAFLNRGFQIIQCETIEKIGHSVDSVSVEPVPDELVEEWEFAASIQKCLASLKLSASDLKKVDAIFKESLTLNTLHDRLVKAFGKKGNHPIYGKLKALHKQYQKTLPQVEQYYDEAVPQTHDALTPVVEKAEEKRPGGESQSREVNENQLIDVAVSGGIKAEDTPVAAAAAILPAEPVSHPDQPLAEIKKKTRGRKRKQPSSKPKTEHETIQAVLPESAADRQAENLDETEVKPKLEIKPKLEQEALSESIPVETSAEPTDQQVEKKKRRPGRPRKKNGSSRSAVTPNVKEEKESIIKEGPKTPESE